MLLAGCTLPEGDLEAASVRTVGRVELVDGLALVASNVTVAARDAGPLGTPGAPVELGEQARARTRLHRDAWVLRLELRETTPGSAEGAHVAELEWNGARRPDIRLAQTAWGRAAEGVTLEFDVGPRLEPSSVYVLRVRAAS